MSGGNRRGERGRFLPTLDDCFTTAPGDSNWGRAVKGPDGHIGRLVETRTRIVTLLVINRNGSNTPRMDLSIVIPAFEESKKIAGDIAAAAEFLVDSRLQGEILIVDDGSADDTSQTAKAVEIPPPVTLRVIRYEPHAGKGYAVRTGIGKTNGQYVMFADSGLCAPYENARQGLELIKSGACDIAHGSRKTPGCRIERAQSLYRRICSELFHRFVVLYLKVPIEFSDTQCGYKIYDGDVARKLYGKTITNGFAFDIEVVLRALGEGYRIKEFPLNWSCDHDSRLSPSRSIGRVFSELMTIKRALSAR